MAVAGVELVAMIATGVVFVAWTRRMYRNVAPLGDTTRFAPGWAVGAWFVPILNWFRPKQILDEVWRAGTRAGRPESASDVTSDSALPDAWWATFLIASIGSRIGTGMRDADDLRGTAHALAMSSMLEVVWMIAAVLAFWFVVRASDRQEDAAARRWSIPDPATDSWPTSGSCQQGSLRHESLLRWALPLLGIAALVISFALLAPNT